VKADNSISEQLDIMFEYAEDDTPVTISQESINEIFELGRGGLEESPEESNRIMNQLYAIILSFLNGGGNN
jgi:hypothetical protein